MKKYLLLLILFFIPVFVYAETCNSNNISISNITMMESTGNVEEISTPKVINTGISTNLRLYSVGDSITYNIKIKNNSSDDYVLNKNISNSNNVTYEIISDNNKIKSGEEKTISLRITYSKKVDKSLFNNGKYIENKEINVILGNNVVNPNTGINKIIIALLFIVFLLLSSLLIKKDIKYISVFLILFIPMIVDAACQYQIKISSNIEFSNKNICTYDGELVKGARYVNGQYTYIYGEDDNGLLDEDGWWVFLTDIDSTEPVITPLCSSINNKPIVSMFETFYESKAESINLSSFDTSNVVSMSGMFYGSKAASLDLSTFDTSNVIDMSDMFANSNATSLDLSSFDMSNVEGYRNMFNGSAAETIDISSFDFVNGNLDLSSFKIDIDYYISANVQDLYVKDDDNAYEIYDNSCHIPNIYVGNILKYQYGTNMSACK